MPDLKTKKSLSLLIFCAGVVHYALWLGFFHAEDQRLVRGMCCSTTGPIFQQITIWHRDIPHQFELNKGLSTIAAAWLFDVVGRPERGLLYISQGSIFLSMGLCCLYGWWARKAIWGGICASIFPMIPIIAYAGNHWDVYSLQMPLILAGLWVADSSKGFTSIKQGGMYLVLLSLALFWSERETDNLLLLLSLFSIAGGTWLSVLFCQRDSLGRFVSRRRVLVSGLGMCCACVAIAYAFWQANFLIGFSTSYYTTEAVRNVGTSQTDPWSWVYLSSYWGHLYWRGLGPYLGAMLLACLAWLSLRRRFPIGLFCGFAIPLLVLSIVTKRNYYYIGVVWPLIPVILTTGVLALPKRVVPLGVAVLYLLAAPHFWLRLSPQSLQQEASYGRLLYSTTTYGGIFQTSDGGIQLSPRKIPWIQSSAAQLKELIQTTPCTDEIFAISYVRVQIEEVEMRLKKDQPCLHFKQLRFPDRLQYASLAFIDARKQRQADVLMEKNFVHRGSLYFSEELRVDVFEKED